MLVIPRNLASKARPPQFSLNEAFLQFPLTKKPKILAGGDIGELDQILAKYRFAIRTDGPVGDR